MNSDKKGTYVKIVSTTRTDLWQKLNQKLKHLDVELTERCNNSCVHCNINLPEKDQAALQKELTIAEIKDVLKQATELGCLSVRYTGGEPMLREDFDDLYIFAKRLGMRILLFTNATLINEEKVRLFQKFTPGAPIEVSVYGMTQKSYEAVSRVRGSFKAAFDGIQLLLENDIPFIVKSAFLPQNKEDIDLFENWAASIPWMTDGPRYAIHFDLRARRDSNVLNSRINSLRPNPQESLSFLAKNPEQFYNAMHNFCSKFTSPPGDKLFACGAGHKTATLDAYGNLQVCMLVRHPDTVYNIHQGSLEDALDNFFPKVLSMRASNSEYLEKCATCFLKGLCEQCPGHSWAETGTLDERAPYFCKAAHAQARWLGLLDENEWAWEVEEWRQRLDNFLNKKFVDK